LPLAAVSDAELGLTAAMHAERFSLEIAAEVLMS
jgi:hypothetical protein